MKTDTLINPVLRKAVYAASLDPITNGHINVVKRMAPHYDELLLVVAVNPNKVKSQTFTTEEKIAMAKAAVARFRNVTVHQCIGRYVVKYAEEQGAQVVIRGLRNSSDLETEQGLAATNLEICPNIETIWIPCAQHLMYCSSSAVKSHIGVDPDWEEQAAKLVPPNVLKKLREKYALQKARDHWVRLMNLINYNDKAESDSLFAFLISQYTEPQRAYHNIVHIVSLLDEFERLLDEGEIQPIDLMVDGVGPEEAIAVMLFAIWFHDAVYDTKAKNNEKKSSTLAMLTLHKIGLDHASASVHTPAFCKAVEDLIFATKHENALTEDSPLLVRLMVDLDLMILGKAGKEFWSYEAAIAEEYAWAGPGPFAGGRAGILRSFLARPQIYSTQEFHLKYETAARENIWEAILKLGAD